jgi:hypothetical protein
MVGLRRNLIHRCLCLVLTVGVLAGSLGLSSGVAWAADPPPQSGSIGLEGTISSKPPTQGATITVPANGATFTSVPITVSGLCPKGLLIKIFSNGVFVGSTLCVGGSYSLQVDLFSGRNDLVARVYDSLDQAGPDSNKVTVIFNDAQFLQQGSRLSLTSPYAERGAPPGTPLQWPIILSGGVGPYAISVDWGDGSPADLLSQPSPGTITLTHTYKTAGVYKVVIKATDKNGAAAFLQLVGQATGAVQNNKGNGNATIVRQTVWWPPLAMIPLIPIAYWLGGRQKLHSLKHQFDDQ